MAIRSSRVSLRRSHQSSCPSTATPTRSASGSRNPAQDAHAPTTPGPDDANFQRHNVLVLPEEPLQGIRYAPGALAIEAPDTLRFDLLTGSPYSRGPQRGWQKGRYRLLVCGTQDAPSGRPALTDLSGVALDGEPRAPANGAISGDGTAAGDFSITFTVG